MPARWRNVRRSPLAMLEHAEKMLDLVGPGRRRRLRNQIARLKKHRKIQIPADVLGMLPAFDAHP